MSEYPIPSASLARLRASYEQYNNLALVVAEALGITSEAQIDIQRGVFVTAANGKLDADTYAAIDAATGRG